MKATAKGKITATLEFSRDGLLKCIFLSAQTEADQAVLLKGLHEYLKVHSPLLKRIFRTRS